VSDTVVGEGGEGVELLSAEKLLFGKMSCIFINIVYQGKERRDRGKGEEHSIL
jgi:hypothetical protein